MSEKQLIEYMTTQRNAIADYANQINDITKTLDEIGIQWIKQFSVNFRENWNKNH